MSGNVVKTAFVRGWAAAISKAGGAILAFATQIILARILGINNFGAFAFIVGVVNFAVIFSRFGLDTVALRYVAVYRAERDSAAYNSFQRFSNKVVLGVGLLVAAVAAFLLSLDVFQTQTMSPAVLVSLLIAIPAIGLSGVKANSLLSLGPVVLANIPELLVRPLILILGIVLVYYKSGAVDAEDAMISFAMAAVFSLVASTYWLAKVGATQFERSNTRRDSANVWTGAAAAFLMSSVAYFALTQADILIVGAILGEQAVGGYAAAARISVYVMFLLVAVQSTAAPMISRYYEDGDRDSTQRVLDVVGVVSAISAVLIGGVAIIFAPEIMSVFGSEFVSSADILRVLAAAQILRCMTGATGVTVNMTGLHREGLYIQLAYSILGVALSIVVARLFGALYVAYVVAITLVLWNVTLDWYIWRRTGLKCWFRMQAAGNAASAFR